MRLPGVVGQGETEAEAVAPVAEAFQLAFKAYRDAGQPIPWSDVEIEPCPGVLERWIAVDVKALPPNCSIA